MNKISVVQGTKYSLVDGIERKNIGDDSFYYLDGILLLQTSFDLQTMKHTVIIKQEYLTFKEKEILDRLLARLNLKLPEEQKIVLYGSDGWILKYDRPIYNPDIGWDIKEEESNISKLEDHPF